MWMWQYVLNLVNFHSVDFTGKASGKAIVKSLFNDPDAYAKLDIKEFTSSNTVRWECSMLT